MTGQFKSLGTRDTCVPAEIKAFPQFMANFDRIMDDKDGKKALDTFIYFCQFYARLEILIDTFRPIKYR